MLRKRTSGREDGESVKAERKKVIKYHLSNTWTVRVNHTSKNINKLLLKCTKEVSRYSLF